MRNKVLTAAGIMVLGVSTLPADFSYKETSTITGGALVGALKVAGVFSKSARQAREPIESTVAVKGDRMVHRSPTHIQIIDLAKQTITSVDLEKKTYTEMTFEQMKQALDEMSKKMGQAKQQDQDKTDVKFKVSANATGKTKQVSGLDAKEMVLTMTMEATDKKSGQSGAMVTIADEWIAAKVPGFDEVRDFHRKMAEKLAWTPGSNMFGNRPDMSQGMAQVAKETAKLDGMPVFITVSMGPEGMTPVDRSDKTAQPAQSKGPGVKSAIGGALGGRFGIGRKKEPPPEQQQQAEAGGTAPGVLIEMTTETTNFSSSPVDASQFEVPAGFKQVQFDPKRGMQ